MTTVASTSSTHAAPVRATHASAAPRSGHAASPAAAEGADFAAVLAREIGAAGPDAAGTASAADERDAANPADPGTRSDAPRGTGDAAEAIAPPACPADATRAQACDAGDAAPDHISPADTSDARAGRTSRGEAAGRPAAAVVAHGRPADETSRAQAGGPGGAGDGSAMASDPDEPLQPPHAWGRSVRPPASATARDHAAPASAVATAASGTASTATPPVSPPRADADRSTDATSPAAPTMTAWNRVDAPATTPADPSLAASAAMSGSDAPATAAAHDTPPIAEARLPTPPDAPGFGAALGSQLRLWVREGLQHARLQFNPVELGPVTVRIELDGTRANVDFVAQQASTRSAIEAALPVLAGALRESGLTLAGGGVFEQPRDRPGDAPPQGARTPGGDPAAPRAGDAATPAADTRVRRGLVDLVA